VTPVLNRIDLRGVTNPATVLPRPADGDGAPAETVQAIIDDVRAHGDEALVRLTEQFDGVRADQLRVDPDECRRALSSIDDQVRVALEVAAGNIAAFHRDQVRPTHRFEREGLVVEGRIVPVDRAGCYVPGGRGAYPSTVLMTAIPAREAGVSEVVLCVPPDRATGTVAAVTLAAAAIAGVDEVYAVGGAQAIAAMAYGTESIAPVDVIAGPGNMYVALAKRLVSGKVGIAAAFAGPSEIVVVADDTAPVDLVAIDLMVQAEHGPDGLSWLITWSEAVADAVDRQLAELVAVAPRRAEIDATMSSNGWCALVDGPDEAIAVANLIAPEHLQLMAARPQELALAVRNAGAVFCGPLSPASFGDYVAGPSHVLPTHGSARFGSALTVDDFTKQVHIVTVDAAGLEAFGPAVEVLAAAEGFEAHAESIRMRRPRDGS
jgi:histidinol dehydrogenase